MSTTNLLTLKNLKSVHIKGKPFEVSKPLWEAMNQIPEIRAALTKSKNPEALGVLFGEDILIPEEAALFDDLMLIIGNGAYEFIDKLPPKKPPRIYENSVLAVDLDEISAVSGSIILGRGFSYNVTFKHHTTSAPLYARQADADLGSANLIAAWKAWMEYKEYKNNVVK